MSNPIRVLGRALGRSCYRVYINFNRLCGGMAGEELPVVVELSIDEILEIAIEKAEPKQLTEAILAPKEEPEEKKELVGICPVCLKKARVITADRTSWNFRMSGHADEMDNWPCAGSHKIPCEVY